MMIKNSMPRILNIIMTLSVLLIAPFNTEAQRRPKYEDVLKGILVSEPASAVAALKSYLDDDPYENASQYLQLGLIYHKRFEESDPLRQYKKAMANIKLSGEALLLANQFLNEKDVSRNAEVYPNFATLDERGRMNISYDSIITVIELARQKQQVFKNNVPSIYESFTSSYQEYSKANKLFTAIIGRYTTLKELYLLYDDGLSQEFDALKSSYDLALKHFEAYKAKTDTFDVGYRQQLVIDDINIYRLDGLSVGVNFLQEKIPISNYGKWVDDTRASITAEIDELRTQMVQNERLIATKLRRTEEDFKNGTYEQLKVDKQFLFTLRKYDLRSVIEPLFIYKEHKHTLMHQEHWAITIDADSTNEYDRKMSSYGRMIHNIKRADTVLNEVIRRDVAGSYEKYPEFIEEYYHGMEGIKSYANEELAINRKDLNHYVDKIQTLASAKYAPITEQNQLKFGRVVIPDFISETGVDETNPNELSTTQIVRNIDGSEYLGGMFYHKTENKKAAFICKKEANGKISWYKELLLQMDSTANDSHTEMAVLYAAQTGCVFVLNGTHVETQAKFNVIVEYDEEGNRTLQHDLEVESYPRSIDFVQETHSYMVTFKGEDSKHNFDDPSALLIDNINALGVSVWEANINLTGNVTGVVITGDGYVISGNYQSIHDMNGQVVKSNGGEATFLIKLNKQGEMTRQLLFPQTQAYHTNLMFKTGDHAINIFGSTKGHGNKGMEDDPNALVHFIVTKDLHVVSDSFER